MMSSFKFLSTALLLIAVSFAGLYAKVSVNVLDPRNSRYTYPASIDEMVVTTTPQGIYMEYGVYLTFSARGTYFTNTDTLEVEFLFDLPPEAIVNDCWLWVDDVIVKAKLIERWNASLIYEGIVKRRRDPCIFYKNNQTAYELRIFPMAGERSRKIKINYLLPVSWSAKDVTSPLPFNFASASRQTPNVIKLMSYVNNEFINPRTDNRNLFLTAGEDSQFGSYFASEIPFADVSKTTAIMYNNPMKEGIYFNHTFFGKDKFYQMAMFPAEALKFDPAKKMLFLIDYDPGTSSYQPEDVIEIIRGRLETNYTARDSFNLILTSLDIAPVSSTWIPADRASIDMIFNNLPANPVSAYTNLPTLLSKALDFVNANGGEGAILLFSNSYQVGSRDIANNLITDLKKKTGTKTTVSIAEYATQNLPQYKIGDKNWTGNEYFFSNLARLTRGNYYNIRKLGYSMDKLAEQTLQGIGWYVNSFDLHSAPDSGFCYARYYPVASAQTEAYSAPIIELAKYHGKMPFNITATGFYKDSAFVRNIKINEGDFANPQYQTDQFWIGNYIKYLETERTQSNDVISEIIDVSMANRVLSIYTAFLALEPSMTDTTEHKSDSSGSGDLPNDVEIKAGPADVMLFASPNPLNVSQQITIKLADSYKGEGLSVEIFNSLGQLVRTFDPPNTASGSTINLNWMGDNDLGMALPNGTYLLVVKTPGKRYVLYLVILR